MLTRKRLHDPARAARCRLAAGLALAMALALYQPGEAPAQEQSVPAAFEAGYHIVRRGESLWWITARYLGDEGRWRENWALNPEIEDPNVLRPGQRIRVLLEAEETVPTALLRQLSGVVEGRPMPLPWSSAQEADLLVEKDGLRTESDSSTGMVFPDGTSVVVSEESVIFLRRSGRQLARVDAKGVEIVEGQADVEALLPGEAEADIEIVVGSALATPATDESGRSLTRARKAPQGGAQVMVYEGEGAVEAAGETVAMERGTGTSVAEGAPPSPPEKLLPAPSVSEPAAGAASPVPNPWFRWTAVSAAVSYTLELCRDPDCIELVRREAGLGESSWRPERLAMGSYHWRVTAVSGTGLDGYPSPAAAFSIAADAFDRTGPTATAQVHGRRVHRQGRTLFDAGARVEVAVADDRTGVASWAPVVDGEEAEEARLQEPWATGTHRIGAVASDGAGNRSELELVSFEVDATGPEIRWQAGSDELVAQKVGAEAVTRRWSRRRERWESRAAKDDTGLEWVTIALGGRSSALARRFRHHLHSGMVTTNDGAIVRDGEPEVLILTRGLGPEGAGVYWISATDDGAGVYELTLTTVESGLRLEAVDLLGNRTSETWPLP